MQNRRNQQLSEQVNQPSLQTLYQISPTKNYTRLESIVLSNFHMANCQQLFEINKRINQIKRNLQSRQEKAQEWSMPYEKILSKPLFSQTLPSCFRGTHQGKSPSKQNQMAMTFNTKTQRKIFFEKKAKQSRKKINQFHNELKQLQELQQLKTKLYVHKEHLQQANKNKEEPINYDKSSKPQLKTLNKLLNNTMMTSGGMSMSMSKQIVQKNPIRTLKDRVNPFFGLRAQKMIEIYQEGKYTGKENVVNQMLGMGIEFTPYSTLKKDMKKDEESDDKILGEKTSSLNQIPSTQRTETINEKYVKSKNLRKTLNEKIGQKKNIYLEPIESQERDKHHNRSKLNIFQQRMKKLIEESTKLEDCEGNYVEMLKKCRNKQKTAFVKSSVGQVKANSTYKAVFEGQ